MTLEFFWIDEHCRYCGSWNRSWSLFRQQFRFRTGFDFRCWATVVFGQVDLRCGRGCLLFGWYHFHVMDAFFVVPWLCLVMIRRYFEQFDGWLRVEIRIRRGRGWGWGWRHTKKIAILEKLFSKQRLLVKQMKNSIWIDGWVSIVSLCIEQAHA